MEKVSSYKQLIVWQKSLSLVFAIYKLTALYPKEEVYGISSQMRRAAVSIPSNIAEGWYRDTKKDYRHFLIMSQGSGAELETQIEISKKLEYRNNEEFVDIDNLLLEVMKMLRSMIAKLD